MFLLRHLRSRIGVGLLALLCLAMSGRAALSAEVIPPVPREYFNDYAKVVSPAVANQMNAQLEQFERDTSSQVVVAVFPRMQSDSSIEDYTVRVAQAWKVGQKGTNNGAVLFVFIEDRSLFLQVGYGLEGALPDALAKQIIENDIKPHFKNGDYDSGFKAGVTAILQAVRGEYKGSGRTVADRGSGGSGLGLGGVILMLFILIAFLRMLGGLNRGRVYHRRGYGSWGGGGWGGGGGWSGGGGGGGFSGGGGSFGGGGAGGRW